MILITGVTGYIGKQLLAKLSHEKRALRCLAHHTQELALLYPHIEMVMGDVKNEKSLLKALTGVTTAFYLIHSMKSEKDFVQEDREAAIAFAKAASKCDVKRIIYLGALAHEKEIPLSPHLKSRHDVGNYLRRYATGVQVLELRSSIIIGSGSLSFEMIRSLVEKVPVMITPKWVWTMAQPIGIEDVLSYLIQSIDLSIDGHQIFEIGGKETVSYADLMKEYARQRDLTRLFIPVPVLTPRLSSLWLGLVTPLYARVGKKLIESAYFATIVHDKKASLLFRIFPKSYQEVIEHALKYEENYFAKTNWEMHFYNKLIASKKIQTSSLYGRSLMLQLRPIEESEKYLQKLSDQFQEHPIFLFHPLKALYFSWISWTRKQSPLIHTEWYLDQISPIQLRWSWNSSWGEAALKFIVIPDDQPAIIQSFYFHPRGLKGIIIGAFLRPFHRWWLRKQFKKSLNIAVR